MDDYYYTVEHKASGKYFEKGSKFLSFIYPAEDTHTIRKILDTLRKEYHNAHHHVYAYMLGHDIKDFRAYDDGEPSGSSGMPVLGQIRANELTNVLIIVVRYFGGTKLGIPGLIHAYKEAAANAIENTRIIKKTIDILYNIEFDYPETGFVQKIIKELDLKIIDQKFMEKCSMVFSIRRSESNLIERSFSRNHKVKINKLD